MTGKRTREFNPGPPSNARRVNFYGHFSHARAAKRLRVNQCHEQALREYAAREGTRQ